MKSPVLLAIFIMLLVLTSFLVWPQMDSIVSGWFYKADGGFTFANHPLSMLLHGMAYYGARILGIGLALVALIALARGQNVWGITNKSWLFLFLALMIGPVLIANVVLKDHWGRARPREITEFGGSSNFSPAWMPQLNHHKNDSFVAGDAAFGFYLTSFAYVLALPKKREKKNLSRRFFWSGIAAGLVFGAARIVMGAHFLSDVLFAAFFMLASSAVLHAVMFSYKETTIYWRNWFFADSKKAVT